MDELGSRIITETEIIRERRQKADALEEQARTLRRWADEEERLLELARVQR